MTANHPKNSTWIEHGAIISDRAGIICRAEIIMGAIIGARIHRGRKPCIAGALRSV